MRIDRMLAITVLLLNRDRVTAKELAQRFEVSVRTIYRDLDAINMAGIPIVSFPGNRGGYGILDNYKLDHQLLTLKDMTAILTSLKSVQSILDDREIGNAFEKIANLIPPDKAEQAARLTGQIAIDMLPWGPHQALHDCLKHLHQAITDNCLIHFHYHSMKGERISRTVEPMTLVMKGFVWYLFGFCRLRNDFRIFRLSRIKELIVLNETFNRRQASHTSYFKSEQTNLPSVDLVLRFSPQVRTAITDYFKEEDITPHPDGSLLVKVTLTESEWIYGMILSYGEHIEVLAPERVRRIISQRIQKMAENYSKDQT